MDKAPKLGLDTTADGLDAYVSYFRRRGYTVTLDQELFDRRGKLQVFRFAAHQSVREGQPPRHSRCQCRQAQGHHIRGRRHEL